MISQEFWQSFVQTGAPELYLLYKRAQKMENGNVPDDTGPGSSGHGLQ